MRAVRADVLGGPEVLQYVEVDEPTPAPDQVQIAVRLAGINFADVNARRGVYAPPGAQPTPRGFGMDVTGVVQAVGERVERFRVGQRVAGFSASPGYADLAVADQDLVWAVPDTVTDEQAAAFPTVGHTAYHLLSSAARFQSGESVLVTAVAGGVGSVVVQIARLLGAGLVVGAAGTAERAAESLAFGADAAIDYSDGNLVDRLQAAAGTAAVDVVLDAVGGRVRASALDCVTLFGRFVHFGNSSGEPETLPGLREMRERNIGAIGFHLSKFRTRHPEGLSAGAEALLGWLGQDELKVPVADILPLERAADAHRMLESRGVKGKLLLRPDAQ